MRSRYDCSLPDAHYKPKTPIVNHSHCIPAVQLRDEISLVNYKMIST